MFRLDSLYCPTTATPFLSTGGYCECPPCEALRPYVACFWGTRELGPGAFRAETPGLVIPDACMDIIFECNHATGETSCGFYGINDACFHTGAGGVGAPVSRFAIRFYFWAVRLFADETLRGACNAAEDSDARFPGWRRWFEANLLRADTLQERARVAERFLLHRLEQGRRNADVLNAVYRVLRSAGTERVGDVCAYASVSQRQMERLFMEHVGVSVKKTSSLVRYQHVWRDAATRADFDVQDAVERYGYADQSHLLREFAGYHGMTPAQARRLALGRREMSFFYNTERPVPDILYSLSKQRRYHR